MGRKKKYPQTAQELEREKYGLGFRPYYTGKVDTSDRGWGEDNSDYMSNDYGEIIHREKTTDDVLQTPEHQLKPSGGLISKLRDLYQKKKLYKKYKRTFAHMKCQPGRPSKKDFFEQLIEAHKQENLIDAA